jgi:hypothetical protein
VIVPVQWLLNLYSNLMWPHWAETCSSKESCELWVWKWPIRINKTLCSYQFLLCSSLLHSWVCLSWFSLLHNLILVASILIMYFLRVHVSAACTSLGLNWVLCIACLHFVGTCCRWTVKCHLISESRKNREVHSMSQMGPFATTLHSYSCSSNFDKMLWLRI